MDRHVTVSLLKAAVLLNVVKVVAANNNRPLHLHLLDNASQDPTTDRDVAGEGAFLVDVGAFNSLDHQATISFLILWYKKSEIHADAVVAQDHAITNLPHEGF